MGESSGKVVITYANESQAKETIKLFDNNAVDNLVCNVRPFVQKGEVTDRTDTSLLARRVYLMNIPYDTFPHEIEDLCK